jgi:GTP-binding protein EngB required for normal cell division
MTSDISNYLDKCGVYNKKDVRSVSPYDNLMALKKELLPIDVPDLVELVKNTEKAKDSIRDKNILLFIGETGSGKTTSIKALLGYKMGKLKYKGMDWVTPVEKITDPVVLSMHSNPGCKSVTRYIVAAAAKKEVTTKDILLADSPGFGDTAGVEVEIANMLGVSEALKGCKSILPVIVISKDSWGPRGNGLKKLAQTIASLFKDFRDCKDSVSVIINRFDKDERAELKDKFKNVIDELNAAEKANDNFVNVLEHFK